MRLLESRRAREARLLRLLEAGWLLARKAGGLRCDPTARLEASWPLARKAGGLRCDPTARLEALLILL